MDLEIFQRVGLNILKFGDVLLVSLGYKKWRGNRSNKKKRFLLSNFLTTSLFFIPFR
jgi:hypothetical protein